MDAHDIAPMRVCRRQALLDLDLQDRRFGYPVELLQAITRAGWRVSEHDVDYHPRAAGHPLEGLGLGRRDRPDGARLRAGAAMKVLLVAKAPVAGPREDAARCAGRGRRRRRPRRRRAARHHRRLPGGRCRGHLSLAGDLRDAVRGAEIAAALAGWTSRPQRGDGFAERLVNAHLDAGPGLVVQIGMDTPQVTAAALHEVAAAMAGHDAVLAPATDGGWWALARRDADVVRHLAQVRMSTRHHVRRHPARPRAGRRPGRARAPR